jgi:hypothetical protein
MADVESERLEWNRRTEFWAVLHLVPFGMLAAALWGLTSVFSWWLFGAYGHDWIRVAVVTGPAWSPLASLRVSFNAKGDHDSCRGGLAEPSTPCRPKMRATLRLVGLHLRLAVGCRLPHRVLCRYRALLRAVTPVG